MKTFLMVVATIGFLALTAACGAAIGGRTGEKLSSLADGSDPLAMLVAGMFSGGLLGAVAGGFFWCRMLIAELKRS